MGTLITLVHTLIPLREGKFFESVDVWMNEWKRKANPPPLLTLNQNTLYKLSSLGLPFLLSLFSLHRCLIPLSQLICAAKFDIRTCICR